tara:strand:+ start:1516 stop:3099 length:1584 start_codon:yes stop_codon:yes gene_type:complete
VSLSLLLWLIACCVAEGRPLSFRVVDADSGKDVAARFSLKINGIGYQPDRIISNGLRFVSVHESKKQVFVACYSSGKGMVQLQIPDAAQSVELSVAKGFQYLPRRIRLKAEEIGETIVVKLRRWVDLSAKGWRSADAHLHYDRFNRKADRLWYAMMEGDGLDSAHFMFLKGGKVPGEWAVQYGYGKKGEGMKQGRLLTAGMEYRDSAQGHINLLGMPEIVQPIMAGTRGLPNYPTLESVLRRTSKLHGLPVVAHGGSLGRSTTVMLDGILGAPEAIEIGNSHLFSLENWYTLLNLGYPYSPVAGTDLPNFPERDWWQPFLGGMRMYVDTRGADGFEAWKEGLKKGRVFVSSGPLLTEFKVAGKSFAGSMPLYSAQSVAIYAEVASPADLGLTSFELIQNGRSIPATLKKIESQGLVRWRLENRIRVDESCWFAVRAQGIPIRVLQRALLTPTPYHRREAVMHSAPVMVTIKGKAVLLEENARNVMKQLEDQRGFYETNARHDKDAHKAEMLGLFDRAINRLKARIGN